MPVLGAHKGYTRTHQVIADVREFGGGLEVAHRLAEANIITNKNLLPNDSPEDWDRPSGLRIGTTEVTRLGMGEVEMRAIADMIAGVLVEGRDPEHVKQEALELPRRLPDASSTASERNRTWPRISAREPRRSTSRRSSASSSACCGWRRASSTTPTGCAQNRSGVKVGGHQASSASMVSLMTALYFARPGGARPGEREAAREPGPARHQPPARPAGRAVPDDAAPVRRPAVLSEPHEGPGPGRLLHRQRRPRRHRADLGRARAPLRRRATSTSPRGGRQIALIGDAELDEGACWEAIADPMVARLGEVMWVVDLNRQSLDRVVPDIAAGRLAAMFEAAGWHTVMVKYGPRLPSAPDLRARIDAMPNEEYQRLLRADAPELRQPPRGRRRTTSATTSCSRPSATSAATTSPA